MPMANVESSGVPGVMPGRTADLEIGRNEHRLRRFGPRHEHRLTVAVEQFDAHLVPAIRRFPRHFKLHGDGARRRRRTGHRPAAAEHVQFSRHCLRRVGQQHDDLPRVWRGFHGDLLRRRRRRRQLQIVLLRLIRFDVSRRERRFRRNRLFEALIV